MKPRKHHPTFWFPSQLALVLGIQQRDILEWVMAGKIKAEVNGKVIKISEADLVDYLAEHPEYVGRLYCDDLTTSINEFRASLVAKLEERRGSDWSRPDNSPQ